MTVDAHVGLVCDEEVLEHTAASLCTAQLGIAFVKGAVDLIEEMEGTRKRSLDGAGQNTHSSHAV